MNQALTTTQKFPMQHPKTRSGNRAQSNSHSQSHPDSFNPNPTFDLSTAVSPPFAETADPMPEVADQTVLVYTHIEMLAHYDHVPMGYMNRTNWKPQAEPLIYLPREQWDENQFMPVVEATGDWVDIVVNNIDDKGHPFHLVSFPIAIVLTKLSWLMKVL
jgi:hypothetical protein